MRLEGFRIILSKPSGGIVAPKPLELPTKPCFWGDNVLHAPQRKQSTPSGELLHDSPLQSSLLLRPGSDGCGNDHERADERHHVRNR